MEYASGGELFDWIVKANQLSEDEARYFFQQLISGVAWCHKEVRLVMQGLWWVLLCRDGERQIVVCGFVCGVVQCRCVGRHACRHTCVPAGANGRRRLQRPLHCMCRLSRLLC